MAEHDRTDHQPIPAWVDQDLRAAVNASGLWASYADMAEVERGSRTHALPLATANWDPRLHCRLADRNGLAQATGEGPPQGLEAYLADPLTQSSRAVDEAWGYDLSEEAPRPEPLRLSVQELAMLAGEEPATAGLRLRVKFQWMALEEAAEALPPAHPHLDAIWSAVEAGKALERRLAQ